MDHTVCFVLSQRHFRQTVILLQEVFKTQQQDHEKLLRKWNEYDNSVVIVSTRKHDGRAWVGSE